MLDRTAILLVVSCLMACSDLASAEFAGDPLFQVSGRIEGLDAVIDESGDTLIALIWTSYTGDSLFTAQTQVVTSTTFPTNFDFVVYDLPELESIVSELPPPCHPNVRDELVARAKTGQLDDPRWLLPVELLLITALATNTDPISLLADNLENLETLFSLDAIPETNEQLIALAGCSTLYDLLQLNPDIALENQITTPIAFAEIVVFQDVDGDGQAVVGSDMTRSHFPDQLLGVNYDWTVVYLPEPSNSIHEYLGFAQALESGFNLVRETCVNETSVFERIDVGSEEALLVVRPASVEILEPECGEIN